MSIFLGSWAMMFGALFFAYAQLRLRAAAWPSPGEPALPLLGPALNTAVVVASSITLQRALAALHCGQISGFRRRMLATLVLGAGFTGLQLLVAASLWARGLRPGSGLLGSVFYLLSGFHLLHVVVGLGLLAWLLAPALRRGARLPAGLPVRLAARFWHFVAAVWLLLFASLYVL
jgi:heme/copper-type cytochrome/quinol oxidase subunit 3